MTPWLVSLPPRKAKGDAGVRVLKCPCLSTQEGSMSTHTANPSSPPSLSPPPAPRSPVPLALFLIPGHKLRAGWYNSLSVPQDTHTGSLMRMLSQMKGGHPLSFFFSCIILLQKLSTREICGKLCLRQESHTNSSSGETTLSVSLPSSTVLHEVKTNNKTRNILFHALAVSFLLGPLGRWRSQRALCCCRRCCRCI